MLNVRDNNEFRLSLGFGTSSTTVTAILGNLKTGKKYARIAQVQKSGQYCSHKDTIRKIEVGAVFSTIARHDVTIVERIVPDAFWW